MAPECSRSILRQPVLKQSRDEVERPRTPPKEGTPAHVSTSKTWSRRADRKDLNETHSKQHAREISGNLRIIILPRKSRHPEPAVNPKRSQGLTPRAKPYSVTDPNPKKKPSSPTLKSKRA